MGHKLTKGAKCKKGHRQNHVIQYLPLVLTVLSTDDILLLCLQSDLLLLVSSAHAGCQLKETCLTH